MTLKRANKNHLILTNTLAIMVLVKIVNQAAGNIFYLLMNLVLKQLDPREDGALLDIEMTAPMKMILNFRRCLFICLILCSAKPPERGKSREEPKHR
jgi:hypothetical protein